VKLGGEMLIEVGIESKGGWSLIDPGLEGQVRRYLSHLSKMCMNVTSSERLKT
jgi:hypothetical protein